MLGLVWLTWCELIEYLVWDWNIYIVEVLCGLPRYLTFGGATIQI